MKTKQTNNGPKNKGSRKTRRGKNGSSVPVAINSTLGTSGYSIIRGGSNAIRVRGKEVLGRVTANVDEGISCVFDSNPACWADSRLATLARTYEKYRYSKANIRYIPAVPSTQSGVVALYVETDPTEKLSSSVPIISNMEFSRMCSVWSPTSVPYTTPRMDSTLYFCSIAGAAERRETSQFLVTATATGITYPNGVAAIDVGWLEIEYELDFMYQEIELGSAGQQYAAVQVSFPVASAGATAAVTFTGIPPGAKVVELRMAQTILDRGLSQGLDVVAGAIYFLAWTGSQWNMFNSLTSAKALSGALTWTAARAVASTARGYLRQLTFGDNY